MPQNPEHAEAISNFYLNYHDAMTRKRHQSPYWLRAYAHKSIFEGFVKRVPAGATVLDAGCGEGVLSRLLAQKGAIVTGVDISSANIEAARKYAALENLNIDFQQGDIASLPFESRSFDWVVSSHVLEHVPDIHLAAREIARVARGSVLIAMPTCLNPAAWAIVGDGNYWKFSWRTPVAIPLGLAKTVLSWIRQEEGPDGGYVGRKDLPHIWRFPSRMRKQLEGAGLTVLEWEAGPLLIPYLPQYSSAFRRLQVKLDSYKSTGPLRFMGYGTLAVCRVSN